MILACVLLAATASAQGPRELNTDIHYKLPGEAYPGTRHTYWIYVPAQYDPSTPASLMIYNDGQAFLFAEGDRSTNRPAEYNSLDDNVSQDPGRHGIGGASSGAIAAFTVAWQRPNHFRKVLSIVGSFVNPRGGHAYADIVRKSKKEPLRVFLQDGRNDNRGMRRDGAYDETRDRFAQNVRLMQALTGKGYDVNYTWGIGRHGQEQGGAIFPELMRRLSPDQPVSSAVNDQAERSFRGAAGSK